MKQKVLRTSPPRGWLAPLLLLLALAFSAHAQSTLRGKVTDNIGDPLPGVNILIKGTASGVTTDGSGEYTIEIPAPGSVLVFSFIGFGGVLFLIEHKAEILALTAAITFISLYFTSKKISGKCSSCSLPQRGKQ